LISRVSEISIIIDLKCADKTECVLCKTWEETLTKLASPKFCLAMVTNIKPQDNVAAKAAEALSFADIS
jgi:hypothetical protein